LAISTFRSDDAARRYFQLYDRVAATWPVASDEWDLTTSFGPTHIRRSGPDQGVPLVLIHPTSGASLGWARIIEPLAGTRPVITPDTMGTIGRSVQTAGIDSIDDLSRWLDETLDALDYDRVHLLGYSEGGWIAGCHATSTTHPDRIMSLTLVEPAGAIEEMPRRRLVALMARAMRTLAARDKAAAVRSFNQWLSGDIELSDDEVDLVLMAFRSFRQRLPRPKRVSDDALRRIVAPTLVLLGQDSKILDPDSVRRRATSLMPDVVVEIVPDVGHGLPFQRPDTTARRILDFIEQAEAHPHQPGHKDSPAPPR
jgi:pimeloyl-ACP methyl ester carboxylesterase